MKKKITAFIMSVCLVAAMIADPVQAASKKAYIKTGVSSKVTVLCGKTLNLKAKTVNKKKKITYKSSKSCNCKFQRNRQREKIRNSSDHTQSKWNECKKSESLCKETSDFY